MTETSADAAAEARRRAARGAAFLDGYRPGWADKIDIGNLVMYFECKCVLGQLFRYFEDAVEAITGSDPRIDPEAMNWALKRGFIAEDDESEDAVIYPHLHTAWVAEIEARRGGSRL